MFARRALAVPMVLATLAAALASMSAAGCTPSMPPAIKSDFDATPRGVATVVFFTDFQCPFCRKTHAALGPILAARPGKVRVVLHHVPLRMHPDAMTAARAAVCTPEIADDLFAAPDLSEGACEDIAAQHGADRAKVRACVGDPATSAAIERDVALMDALDGDGVPLIFVGKQRFDGAPSKATLEAAIDEAIADASRP